MRDTANQQAAFLDALRGVLAQVAEPSQVLKTILSRAVAQTSADRGVFVEVTRTGELAFRVLYHLEKEQLTRPGHFSRSVFAKVLQTGKPVRLGNAMDDPDFASQKSVIGMHLVSVLCMPIRVEGRVAALVHLEATRPDHFHDDHERTLQALLDVAGPALGALQAGEKMLRNQKKLQRSEEMARRELEDNRELLARDWSFGRFIGRSKAVRELEQTVRKASAIDFPVLLLGETGTGKSILARVLHHSGPRAKETLATVFCPSLEKGMVETELFGHKKGAFTGAVGDQVGKVQTADKGTIFLDEIGELPLEIQPKLLRLLQEKTYERVGDPTERSADVRVIAATNRDLEAEVRARTFRRDLFERLNFLPIRIPPLRERREDIPLLLRHCLEKSDAGRWVDLTPEAEQLLVELDFAWPGNVRTLEQLAARLAMEGSEEPIGPETVQRLLGQNGSPEQESAGAGSFSGSSSSSSSPSSSSGDSSFDIEVGLPELLAKEEKKWLEKALERYSGITRAQLAEKLKISEAALYKKLKLYGIK